VKHLLWAGRCSAVWVIARVVLLGGTWRTGRWPTFQAAQLH
jgi:hypothetical protein